MNWFIYMLTFPAATFDQLCGEARGRGGVSNFGMLLLISLEQNEDSHLINLSEPLSSGGS